MNSVLRILRRFRRSERGNTSVEFAFIAVTLLMVTLGTFEAGRFVFTYFRITSALGATTRMVQMRAPAAFIVDSISDRFSPDEQGSLIVQINPNFTIDGRIYTRIDVEFALQALMPTFNLFPEQAYTLRVFQLVPTDA